VASPVDLRKLRELVDDIAVGLANAGGHRDIPAAFARAGLPVPASAGSKTYRGHRSVEAIPDADLPRVAPQVLAGGGLRAETRNAMEDLLWAAEPGPQIQGRTRRELARDLELDVFLPAYEHFKALLHRLWVLGNDADFFFTPNDGWSLSADIDRHVRDIPGDWTAEYLFEQIGAFDAVDRRFALFLEGLVSGQTLPDEQAQRRASMAVLPSARRRR
jgi:hypothetical protein